MSLDCADVVEELSAKLEAAGYSFHEGPVNEEGFAPGQLGHWYAWCDGRCDVITGDTHHDVLAAYVDALAHFAAESALQRAALRTIVDEGPDEAPEMEDYDDTESAYSNGMDVASWGAAQVARRALMGEPAEPRMDVPTALPSSQPFLTIGFGPSDTPF